ncbi:hypothetical protein ACVWZ4_004462 [Bradyrhizobium sp. USDA 4472]
MASQISQQGREYRQIAQSLLRAVKTMTDRTIAAQLKALADDYERRAEKASHAGAAKAITRSASSAEREWRT